MENVMRNQALQQHLGQGAALPAFRTAVCGGGGEQDPPCEDMAIARVVPAVVRTFLATARQQQRTNIGTRRAHMRALRQTLGTPLKSLLVAAAALAVFTSNAQAAALMRFTDTGTGVSGVLSGSLDLTGLNPTGSFSANAIGMESSTGRILFGVAGATQVLYDSVLAGPASFGTGVVVFASSLGDAVFLGGDTGDLYLPSAYVSGGALSGTLSFAGATYASLGVGAGDFVYTLSSGDTLTVRFEALSAVPEPATGSLMGLGLALAAVGARCRRNRLG